MRSSERKNGNDFNNLPVHFENLEERLLLTTLYGGDFFIYRTSQEDVVRIDLIGDPTDCVELLALWQDLDSGDRETDTDRSYDLVDLVGFYNGNLSGWYRTGDPSVQPVELDATGAPVLDPNTGLPIPITDPGYGIRNIGPESPGWIPNVINWPILPNFDTTFDPALQGYLGSMITDGSEWVDYAASAQQQPGQRGAETEIFVVYIMSCTSDTRLVITELAGDELGDSPYSIDVWGSDNPPLLDGTTAPDDTGSVLVGAGSFSVNQQGITYRGQDFQIAGPLNPDGIFNSGITISDGTFAPQKDMFGAFSLVNPNVDWASFDWTNPDYDTLSVPAEPFDPPMDMGRIIIGGSVAGEIYAPGSVEVIYMGFLWGDVTIEHNLGDIILCGGGGGVIRDNSFSTPSGGSLIHVGGTLDMVLVDALNADTYDLWSAVEVENDPSVAKPENLIYELEYGYYSSFDWLAGELCFVDNDTMERAQIINHPTGNFTLYGDSTTDGVDWYAMPLMAGQTIVVDGYLYYGGEWDIYSAVQLYGPADEQNNIPESFFFDPAPYDLRWMGSFGYETIEDYGEASAPYDGTGTPKPLVFTAPAAGVYYLVVVGGCYYDLDITNGTHAALGGVEIVGSYGSRRDLIAYPVPHYGTGIAENANIAVKRGGDLGALIVSQESFFAAIRAMQGGDVVCVQAGLNIGGFRQDDTIYGGGSDVTSDGYIGRVAAVGGVLYGDIVAGRDGNRYTGFYGNYTPYDAHIQNIYAADVYWIDVLSATGSIGTIHVGGDLLASEIIVNSDWNMHSHTGDPAGYIDLVEVGGGAPHIYYNTGPGGDVGYVRYGSGVVTTLVNGGYYPGTGVTPSFPIMVDDGSTTILRDDGGGELTITPLPVLDANGNLQYDIDGEVIKAQYYYTFIPCDNGQGGILTNLTFGGNILLTATGKFQIGNLNAAELTVDVVDVATGGVISTTTFQPQITIGGPGVVDIYYLDGYDHAASRYTDIVSFVNNTPGHLFAGTAGGIQYMKLAGDLGQMDVGHTGAWLFGPEQAPVISIVRTQSPNIYDDEPQFGWFHATINGLNIVADNTLPGDLLELIVDGSIGDLRVEGTIGDIVANADGVNDYDKWNDWDGINGLIWSGTRIDFVDVGDGLADDGDADVARAAIISTGSIGTVYISGNRYERTPDILAGINEALKRPIVYGELNGAIIGHVNSTITQERMGRIVDSAGNIIDEFPISPLVIDVDAVGQVIGVGSTLTALVYGTSLDGFQCFGGPVSFTGSVGTIRFTGQGAEIYGAEVLAHNVREVITSADSNGISHSRFVSYLNRPGSEHGIGQIIAGGPGMSNCYIYALHDSIGTIKTAGNKADIKYCEIESTTSSIDSITARDMKYNTIRASNGAIGTITAARDVIGDYYSIGALGRMIVARDFLKNEMHINSSAQLIDVNGRFDSILYMTGSSPIGLKSLVVTGDIAGTIGAWGHIGSIISEKGAISADITTYKNDQNADVYMIKASKGFTGNVNIAGSLSRFYSYASVGENPELNDGKTQVFHVLGDLDYFYVIGQDADLFADVNVGGNLRVADIRGAFYSNLVVNGDITALYVRGTLGGNMGPVVGNRGSVTALGSLRTLRFDYTQDLVADITVGSSISSLVTRGGDIIGDITSLFGTVNYVYAIYGNILGNITGVSVNNVRVTGSTKDPATGNIEGDITATNGSVKYVYVTRGNLHGDVTAINGDIYNVSVTYGDISANSDIYADKDIRRIYVNKGDIAGNISAERWMKSIYVSGGDITGIIDGELGVKRIYVTGTIEDATIRSGAAIDYVSAYYLDNAIISAASDIGRLYVRKDVVNSHIMAGYDVGADGQIANNPAANPEDDNPNNLNQVVHAGNIKYLYVYGWMSGTMVCAGMNPNTANLNEASGESSIKRMYVRGGLGANNAFIADTYIDSRFMDYAAGSGTFVYAGVTNPEDEWDGNDFGSDGANGRTWVIGDLRLYLSSGTANYDPATGRLLLEQTDSRSALTIRYTGDGQYNRTIEIACNDDCALGTLTVYGDVQIGDIAIDGYVRSINLASAGVTVKVGSEWRLSGGVGMIRSPELTNVDIYAGPIGSFYVLGDYASGEFVADSIKTLNVYGKMAGDTSVLMGDAATITVGRTTDRGGLYGDLEVHGTIRSLRVYGQLDGDVYVTNGDLYTVYADALSGSVSVERGLTRTVSLTSGDLDGSYRASGIGTIRLTNGSIDGLVCSSDYLTGIYLYKGDITGRIAAQGNISSITTQNINNALITAAGDIARVSVRYDMNYSRILAGFDPGDAGYYPQRAELADNVTLDRGHNYEDEDDPRIDRPLSGKITLVTVGNEMWMSTIAAGIDPGQDGYCGTQDDRIRGTGYVGRVVVGYSVAGDSITTRKYGVFAANNMPNVTVYRQPFKRTQNVYVEDLSSPAGLTSAIEVRTTHDSLTVTFKNPLDFSSLTRDNFSLLLSRDPEFDFTTLDNYDITFYRPGYDPYDPNADATVTYDRSTQTLTLKLINKDWGILDKGVYARLTIDGTTVTDIRGNSLGKDLQRLVVLEDVADNFTDAELMPLYLDGGTIIFDSIFNTTSDIDIFGFQANAYEFFSAQFLTSNLNNEYGFYGYAADYGVGVAAQMALFFQDDQGTEETDDDFFELVARHEYGDIYGNVFQAFELPETGNYYLVLISTAYPAAYQINLTLSSTDQKLVQEIGGLPAGEQIAYVSNYVGEHNNLLGANDPKQLVYLDFDGGRTTQYGQDIDFRPTWMHDITLDTNVDVDAFDIVQIDQSLDGYTDTLIFGDASVGVTGIVENVLKIYSNTAESYTSEQHPNGKQLTVRYIDPTDPVEWNEYLNATEGLWFTTADPAAKGLDPTEDFTTVFIGEAQDWMFGPALLGLASTIDVANQSKADNAIVYTGNYGYVLRSMGAALATDTYDRINQYSRVLANTVAHELGHTLGLNHQPTYGFLFGVDAWLHADDPDNDPSTMDDSNQHDFADPNSRTGPALMGYPDTIVELNELSELGTAPLSSLEFLVPSGTFDPLDPSTWYANSASIDTQDLLLRWLA